MSKTYGCNDAINDFDLVGGCCDSCHEDFELGYANLDGEIENEGKTYVVCCRIMNEYRAQRHE